MTIVIYKMGDHNLQWYSIIRWLSIIFLEKCSEKIAFLALVLETTWQYLGFTLTLCSWFSPGNDHGAIFWLHKRPSGLRASIRSMDEWFQLKFANSSGLATLISVFSFHFMNFIVIVSHSDSLGIDVSAKKYKSDWLP